MPKLFLGEAHSREKALIMDMRMLRFSANGMFVAEIPYSVDYVARGIKEVNGVSVLYCLDSDYVEIACIINNNYSTFTLSGRPTVIISKLQNIDGLVDSLSRQGDGYLQAFILFDRSIRLSEQAIRNILTM